ncbi:ABC-type multidrug transport system fused ATPase/permease subunit [Herbaspirillum sp. Sphag1AN]|uniref:hypothetical protein n=1 Tax=unclassified Herbaspirillum TaxID=2624150 RepID=UPI001618F981|nr:MULTISPECIES: hypothetical protein [unclassified Herbaspirillum]MBB3212970.1 ABC-type multidrug transport system fused ATPase/permease subunit [Herbaspirillum sp. Sphag1AN]MBB3246167.1 ABC-type multidrug transport system fused ATPase/permease subunit [Herbaspirillum sp. Sphag64]
MLAFNKTNFDIFQVCKYLFFLICILLTIIAFKSYSGDKYIYLLFTLISNVLLYFSFRKKAIFFDAFIGVFLWLGFWLKLTIRVGFTDGIFHESVGSFDGSGPAFDRGLLVTSCGMLGLVCAALIRGYVFSYQGKKQESVTQPGIFNLYQRHRKIILILFVLFFISIALSNIYYGIYQRGQVPLTIPPFGIGGIYKWLLLFGLASFSAIILQFEYSIGRSNSFLAAVISLLEGFVSNVSLLSRGMILNSTSLFYGLYKNFKINLIPVNRRFFVVLTIFFSILFISSVFVVNHLRYSGFLRNTSVNRWETTSAVHEMTIPLFVDRWVGMEGVLAVSSSHKGGWDLWKRGWQEVYSDNSTSFFDLNLVNSPYLNANTAIHHYISLPGIIAFCFYPGSFPFLFVCLFIVGVIGAVVEIFVYRIGGKNLILCSLLAQAIAYRFANFGYAPMQSYLIFGSLFMNLVVIYGADKLLAFIYLRDPAQRGLKSDRV